VGLFRICRTFAICLLLVSQLVAQRSPLAADLDRIQQATLTSDYGYQRLEHLCNVIGPRMAGSPQAAAAVDYVADQFRQLGLQVSLEATSVPHWVRGAEIGELVAYPGIVSGTSQSIVITALGGSVPTPAAGITAPVVVVRDFDQLNQLGKEVAGKIVLFNVKFDQSLADLGYSHDAYLQVVRYRVAGPNKAAELGAVASLLRSIGPGGHRLPHTGSVIYFGDKKIPVAAVTAEDADLIARLASQGAVKIHLVLTPQLLPDAPSHNVIADIRGTEHPEQVVIVSAHLDSWDLGTGALDNGAGVAVVMQAAQVLHELGLRPKRTLRFIAWMNEEHGGSGYTTYIEEHRSEFPNHVANIEIDNGSGHPVGYTAYADDKLMEALSPVNSILSAMGSGVAQKAPDIMSDLDEFMPGFDLITDNRNYYDYHHTAADTFDKISLKGLQEQSAVVAILAYALADLGREPANVKQK
jgi:carboxypeptidase Q